MTGVSIVLESFAGKPAVVVSAQMAGLLERVRRIANANASVLIEGESGSGKEIVAKAVHQYSARATKPWIDVSCAALPETLVESELFGYERGAFSGALQAKPGLFELANGGTLFLDEIGELPLHLQAKLLRVLDGSGYFKLGGTRKVMADVRIVAATNRGLKGLVQQKLFREDLYYRLNQVSLRVPALRERPDDVLPLAAHFLNEIRPGATLSRAATGKLQAHHWPGNVRELRNVITSAALDSDAEVIDVPYLLLETETDMNVPNGQSTGILGSVERDLVLATLRKTQGDRQQTADALGISIRTLGRRLREYGQEKGRPVTA